jgi:hypothetical protein
MPWCHFSNAIDWSGRPPVIDLRVPVSPGHLLALADSLPSGALNDAQQETVQALRDGILALVKHETVMPIADDPV